MSDLNFYNEASIPQEIKSKISDEFGYVEYRLGEKADITSISRSLKLLEQENVLLENNVYGDKVAIYKVSGQFKGNSFVVIECKKTTATIPYQNLMEG